MRVFTPPPLLRFSKSPVSDHQREKRREKTWETGCSGPPRKASMDLPNIAIDWNLLFSQRRIEAHSFPLERKNMFSIYRLHNLLLLFPDLYAVALSNCR